jgi:hypothetical protein
MVGGAWKFFEEMEGSKWLLIIFEISTLIDIFVLNYGFTLLSVLCFSYTLIEGGFHNALFIYFFDDTRLWTQGLRYGRQVFHHLS